MLADFPITSLSCPAIPAKTETLTGCTEQPTTFSESPDKTMTPSFFAAFLGFLLAALIFYLLRRDQLYLRDALFWLATALASLAFGFFPSLVDSIGRVVGVAYPPALILSVVCVVLTLRALLADIALTQLRRDVRRLNQRIALIESSLETRS